MSCQFTVRELNKRTGQYYLRPCGSCTFCRINNRTSWEHRIFCEVMEEYGKGNYSTFATLTYNDGFVPVTENGNLTVREKDIDNFIYNFNYNSKRLFNRKYKQYLVSEYGDTFGRPHYHSIIMGLDPCKRNLISASWLRGHVMALPVLSGAIRYVLKYMDKQIFGEQAKEVFRDREIPFTKKSHGIGKDWILEHLDELSADKGYVYKGHFFNLTSYQKSFLSNLDSSVYDYKIGKLNEKVKKIASDFDISYIKADQYNSVVQELSLLKNALNKDCVASHDEINYLERELSILTPKKKVGFKTYELALKALGA